VLAGPGRLERVCVEAVEAGVRIVQIRDKTASHGELVGQALRFVRMLHPLGAFVIVDDDVQAAVEAGADGAHVGQCDMPAEAARRALGPDRILGVSVRTSGEAAAAEAAGADYVAANLVFPTGTKTDIDEPLGLAGVSRLRMSTRLPLVAIGGIDPANALDVVEAGADGLAVVSAILCAAEVGKAVSALFRAFDPA